MSRFALAVLTGALLCGAFDLVFALVYYGVLKGAGALRVLQTVAGGVLGRASYEGGTASAALGFLLHFVIATILSTIYVGAARRIPLLLDRVFTCGLLYGALTFYAMNMIVLPLSALHTKPWPPPSDTTPLVAHAFGVGLPIAWAARYWLRTARPARG